MGHLLGSETVVKEKVTVRGFGTVDSTFTVKPDEETNFSLFAPTPSDQDLPGAPAALVRLRPNVDLIEQAEKAIEKVGLRSGSLHGIGSLIDLHFENGEMLRSDAIEIMITAGRFSQGREGAVIDHVDATGVGIDGSIKSGRLERGRNRICVTAELLIVGDRE
jgi:predicted DNA-binding protein with PD1-like motif